MKVIYVSYMRLSDKAARDWFIEDLIKKGVTVEYWDLIPLLFGGEIAGSKQVDYLRTPRSYIELQTMLHHSENRDAHYIMLVSYEGRTAKLYGVLSKLNCRMYFIAWGNLPINMGSKWQSAISRLISNPARFVQDMYYKTKARVYKKLNFVKPYEVVFAAGQLLAASQHYAVNVVPINLVDYDHYIRVRSQTGRVAEGSFAVFLDIHLPYQTDLGIVGLSAIEAERYYQALNRFFEFIEEKFQLKVVIAAHPKANYGREIFQGRETYSGLTPELVRDADLVIAHHSTSISYAVLNKKPVVFIYTDDMETAYKNSVVSYISDLAKYLNAAIYNIDKISLCDQIKINAVDTRCYDDFKYSFLTTHKSENLCSWEIFWAQLSVNEK